MRTKLVIIKEHGQIEEDYQGTHVLLSIEDYTKLVKLLELICKVPKATQQGRPALDIYYPPEYLNATS